jgi:hypothetical protein
MRSSPPLHILRVALVALVFAVGVLDASQRVIGAEHSEDYQVGLWKLYHDLQPLCGRQWASTSRERTSMGLLEIRCLPSDHSTAHICLMKRERFAGISETHELVIVIIVNNLSRLVAACEPTIKFTFDKPIPLKNLQPIFNEKFVIGRLLRLPHLRSQIKDVDRITSVEVKFCELSTLYIDWRCKGFAVDINFTTSSGEARYVTYWVGSGLDPFTDHNGVARTDGFSQKNILIDPEVGSKCEAEVSGDEVFFPEFINP